ncbi:MAG: glycoside hydrolase family 3 C-terminal domain-containing protein [Ardenticatenaceae bacterium]|nr:glycoside hydrolase family 3 C-terminal domain-containing protein [Ardenticatenaceae bacterium]
MTTTFRDLNKNGRLDPYEDPNRPIDERVEDLLSQMTLAEKAGLMFHTMIMPGDMDIVPQFGAGVSSREMVVNRHMNHFNILFASSAAELAAWYNQLQKLAEETRLGIPVTISTDPRHSVQNNPGAALTLGGFSLWPDPLGFGAIGDEALVEEFGNIARQEYLAVGIRTALHPMADLATEPRWGRMNGTFGEDAELVTKLTAAYIRGFQGEGVGPNGVSCMVKHFPGGGPQKDGLDAHFAYGKEQVYPGDHFEYHMRPFGPAFAAGAEQVMPYYGIPVGQTSEDVAMAYNKEIITDLLRGRFGFEGIVCTDWGITEGNRSGEARAWGVEHLTIHERYLKTLDAGVDQYGGQNNPQPLVELVQEGKLDEARLDESVRRLLRLKFKMGLFDNPYIDETAVPHQVGKPEFIAAGELAQRKSVVLLKNDGVLPLNGRPKLYIENIKPETAARYGEVVATPQEADFALLRLNTPYQPPRSDSFLENFFHQGDLDFKEPEKSRILDIMKAVPTIVDIYLERAAVIPEIAAASVGLLGTFSVADTAVLDVIFGHFHPTGKLPMELPSSMTAVHDQKEDVPYDSANPLFPFGFGLTYNK